MEDKNLPLLCSRGAVVFPDSEVIIEVGRKISLDAVDKALKDNSNIFVTTQKDTDLENPDIEDFYTFGTICDIKSYRRKDGHYRVVFKGIERAVAKNIYLKDGIFMADVQIKEDYFEDAKRLASLFDEALNAIESNVGYMTGLDDTSLITNKLRGEVPANTLTDYFASYVILDVKRKQSYLEECNIEKRLKMVLSDVKANQLSKEIDDELNDKVKSNIEESQRDYFLREKLKIIKEELGDIGSSSDIEDLKNLIEKNPYPDYVKQKAKEEIKRYEMLPPSTGETGVIRSYLDWLLMTPWYQKSEDNNDLDNATRVLDEDHYGLIKVKERILEYLAVKQMTNSLKSPIICLVGPPGVGKTSLAKSVARALNRSFVKVSLGGVRDEAEIRGHRRTYLGAMPGRIIQGMRRAGTLNPVFLLDEIDKMASDFKGDPSSAMLEVLDPEQNMSFSDHYLEEPYNLSDVLFIATANYIENIPTELKDRLEIIELSSYTELEKLIIAKKHLITKQLEINGLKKSQFKIDDETLLYLIRHYTREAGVRQLERVIASLCRKTVLALLKDKKQSVKITSKKINEWLGNEKFEYGIKEKKDQVGVVTGLAYTSFGGDILEIEVNYFKGKGRLVITGQLGEIMKESAQIALDYIRANAKLFEIDEKIFEENDIHIHVPEGAVPKDGPSAGVTLTTALVSALSKRKARCDIAMTGEVTLRGNVLPIGGLKEKSLAANRSGIKTIYIPKQNEKDLIELPEVVKKEITFIPVERVEQILETALLPKNG